MSPSEWQDQKFIWFRLNSLRQTLTNRITRYPQHTLLILVMFLVSSSVVSMNWVQKDPYVNKPFLGLNPISRPCIWTMLSCAFPMRTANKVFNQSINQNHIKMNVTYCPQKCKPPLPMIVYIQYFLLWKMCETNSPVSPTSELTLSLVLSLYYLVVLTLFFQGEGMLPYFANFRLLAEFSTPCVNQR